MFNSESVSRVIWLERRNRNFTLDQITKPIQEKDVDVLEDVSSPEHLPQVLFGK